MLPQEFYKRFAVITLYSAVALAAIYIIFNYLWSAILPFLIAYILAECFRPIVRYSERNSKFPKRSFVLFVVILAVSSLCALVYAIGRQIFLEVTQLSASGKEFLARMSEDDGYAFFIIEKISNFIPFVDLREHLWEMRGNLEEEILSIFLSVGDKISGVVIAFIGNAAAFLPNLLLATVVVIIATYYFAIDRVRINCLFLSLFPKNIRPSLKKCRDILANTVGKYLRAYGLLFLITFSELLILFSFLGVEYSFILALVIALVDILPVLGTGTILIPWGLISLIGNNYPLGIGLLIGYAVIVVVRQIIEPRIIGKFIGLSPLASLAAMYIGLRLMGILGLLSIFFSENRYVMI